MDIFERIKIVVFDVDGCLTDGIYQISEKEVSAVTAVYITVRCHPDERLSRRAVLSREGGQCAHEPLVESRVEHAPSITAFMPVRHLVF